MPRTNQLPEPTLPASSIPEGSFQPYRTTAERHATFARLEAHGSSPLYELLAAGVSTDAEIIELLEKVDPPKRQPNLLFAAVLYLGGVYHDYQDFRAFVLGHPDDVLGILSSRRTQTNEVGRCAALLPALLQIPGPLSLVEVGASAGLCLLPDRYAYDYGHGTVGDLSSPVHLYCELRGPAPVPRDLPKVAWRRGIDLDPIDVQDVEAVRWLECCVWPDQPERLARLRAAVRIARRDPPMLVRGDLVERIVDVAHQAPLDTTLVVFHSAVLSYLTPSCRRSFGAIMAAHPSWAWLSNEGSGVIDTLSVERPLADRNGFVLASGGSRVLAISHPHGRWLEWLA